LVQKYTVVASRAFASLSDFALWSEGVLAPGGVWMAMKGRYPEGEISALPHHVQVFHVEHLDVPGLGAERCIVWMRKT
jgi:16S rRNA (guanine527-N7)-methyltransferase